MATFVYAPGIKVIVSSSRYGSIDISEDLVRGSINLRVGSQGGSTLSFTLSNPRRKYEGAFVPNDRVVVLMKRVRWLQVFSGYLSSVPMYSAYTVSLSISADDTLKRLRNTFYDPGSIAFVNLMNRSNTAAVTTSIDSNLTVKIMDVLTEVAAWDREKIHIGGVPTDWYEKIGALYGAIRPDLISLPEMLASSSGNFRTALTEYGNTSIKDSEGNIDSGPGYGYLPHLAGRVGQFGDPGNENTTYEFSVPSHGWVCAMRWPYQDDNELTGFDNDQIRVAKNWWGDRKILVYNPKTGESVVCQPISWGPPSTTGRIIDINPDALRAIKANTGELVQVRFAEGGRTIAYGPVTPASVERSGGSSPVELLDQPPIPVPTTTQGVTPSEDGLTFTSTDQLQGNVVAARQFVQKIWNPTGIGGWRPVDPNTPSSDHPKGLALDVSTGNSGREPTAQEVSFGNSVAFWFTQNPGVFGCKYVIWNNMIYDVNGARVYRPPTAYSAADLSAGHRDHVHLSFDDTHQVALGEPGAGWPVQVSDFMAHAAFGGVIHSDRALTVELPDTSQTGIDGPTQFITTWNYYQSGDAISQSLTGPRILLNDEGIMPTVNQLFSAAFREYAAAPNGDIIAWWPDYFNQYRVLATLVVQPIELGDFVIQWSDRNLVTHQFVTGSVPVGSLTGVDFNYQYALRQLETHGVASIDFPDLLSALLNIDPLDPVSSAWISPDAIYKRFGARPNHEQIRWAASPQAEFWLAVFKFMKAWASQFSSQIPLSFMPELFPGMIIQIPYFGVQFYCDEVTHNFSFDEGGGFSTTANVMAPSTIGAVKGLYGLPRGGAWVGLEREPGTIYLREGDQ